MAFTNSSLATYKRISPHKTSPRNHKIDTITIHCYVGQVTAKEGCDYFAKPGIGVSSNYVVGRDGSIGLCVEEKDRAWTSGGVDKLGNPIRVNGISGKDNDHRAITIEVASDKKEPYAITDAAYKALINLVADICKRNNIKELKWKGDKSLVGSVDKQNMTVHRWFANKSCPGDYLYSRMGAIATEVNSRIVEKKPANSTPKVYKVQTGAFRVKVFANNLVNKIKAAGFDALVVKVGSLYKVQVGAYTNKKNAEAIQKKLKAKGFDAIIIAEDKVTKPTTPPPAFTKGNKVKLQKNAPQYGTSSKFQSWVYSSTLYVRQVDGNRIVISTQKSGAITGAVDKKYLTKI